MMKGGQNGRNTLIGVHEMDCQMHPNYGLSNYYLHTCMQMRPDKSCRDGRGA